MDELTKLEKLFDNFRMVGQDGITVHGSLRTGYAVNTQAIGAVVVTPPTPAPTTGACCDPCGFCTETTEAACTGDSTWMGLGTTCVPNPCTTPRFTVDIHFQFSSTNRPIDGFADFTKTSDPTTATLAAGSQIENWNNSEFMSYHCTDGGPLESVTFDSIGYGLGCFTGIGWILEIDWTGGTLVCLRNFTFQPTDLFPTDPTGVHVYTLSAFGGEWLFTITATITNYP